MSSRFFGQYLLEKGRITSQQLSSALDTQKAATPPIGILALEKGWLTAEQIKQIPLGRLGRPEDIADACVFLASDASSYVTGDSIRVMGGRVIG